MKNSSVFESTVLFGSADKVLGISLRRRLDLWPDKWIFHYDSAPTH
jgi:hypothetical protein